MHDPPWPAQLPQFGVRVAWQLSISVGLPQATP
jgi:hypothetical protein